MSAKKQPPGVAQQQLVALAERRGLAVPHPASRVNLRQLGIYAEVRERFGDKEPASQSDVRRWLKGEADRKGAPSGKQFANDLAKLIGYEGGEAMLAAVQIDHFFPQADLPKGWAGHLANMVILETGFNMTAEFKERGLAKQAFFGIQSYNSNRAWLRWQIENQGRSSINFYQSAENRDGRWSLAIRASDGLTRSAIPPVVSDVSDESLEEEAVATGSLPTNTSSKPDQSSAPSAAPSAAPPLARCASPPPKASRPRKQRQPQPKPKLAVEPKKPSAELPSYAEAASAVPAQKP